MANPPSSKVNDVRIDVDLCFICDCTTTMSPYINQVLSDISNLCSQVKAKLKAELRVAFIAYRDYAVKASSSPEARIECFDFTSDLNEFKNFMKQLDGHGGGGDICEDVLGGLQASLSIKWKSPTKVLFHMFSKNCI